MLCQGKVQDSTHRPNLLHQEGKSNRGTSQDLAWGCAVGDCRQICVGASMNRRLHFQVDIDDADEARGHFSTSVHRDLSLGRMSHPIVQVGLSFRQLILQATNVRMIGCHCCVKHSFSSLPCR